MNIGIFETEHFEVTYTLIRLYDNGEHAITIFTNEATFRQFQYLFGKDIDRYEWIIKKEKESKYRFLLRMYREVKHRKTGLLYLNTISNNFIVYACMIRLLRPIRTIVTLHAINHFFRFRSAMSLRRWVRYAGKRALVQVTREFNVISDTLAGYLVNKLPAHKKVHCLPGAFFEQSRHHNLAPVINGRIHLVVPGSVDARRRNYDTVLELLERSRYLPVSVTLLGPFIPGYGDQIKEKCLRYAATNNNLSFYDTTVVDQPEFDRVMNEAHLILAPSVIHTILVDEIEETYGQSICSGNIADIIKHAKPFIIPQALTIPARLSASAITYNNIQDIIRVLESLLQQPARYEALVQQALHNSGEFTIDKIRARNPTLFIFS